MPPSARAAPSPFEASAPPAGTILGEISGRADLADEVVISGPDSALRTFARVRVEHLEGKGRYVVGSVPEGSYFVVPMGPKGGTVNSTPQMRRVKVTAGSGARADFTLEEPR